MLRWTVDGTLVAELNDPFPLGGPGHDRLGLSSGEWDVYYDDLRVSAAGGGGFAAAAPPPPEPAAGPFSDDFDRAAARPGLAGDRPRRGDARRLRPGDAGRAQPPGVAPPSDPRRRGHRVRRLDRQPRRATSRSRSTVTAGSVLSGATGRGVRGHRVRAGDGRMAQHPLRHRPAPRACRRPGGARRSARRARPPLPLDDPPAGRNPLLVDRRAALPDANDPQPLRGPGQRSFAFSGWETRVHFAHLRIQSAVGLSLRLGHQVEVRHLRLHVLPHPRHQRGLDLPGALAGDAEVGADVLQRLRLLGGEPVLEDVLLLALQRLAERLQLLAEELPQLLVAQRLVGGGEPAAGQQALPAGACRRRPPPARRWTPRPVRGAGPSPPRPAR